MMQNKLSFHQSSVSLEIIGLPDFSNNENILIITSQGTIRLFLQLSKKWNKIKEEERVQDYKVKTGNYCVIEPVDVNCIIIKEWNKLPKII